MYVKKKPDPTATYIPQLILSSASMRYTWCIFYGFKLKTGLSYSRKLLTVVPVNRCNILRMKTINA